jgi:hypothetical protein
MACLTYCPPLNKRECTLQISRHSCLPYHFSSRSMCMYSKHVVIKMNARENECMQVQNTHSITSMFGCGQLWSNMLE